MGLFGFLLGNAFLTSLVLGAVGKGPFSACSAEQLAQTFMRCTLLLSLWLSHTWAAGGLKNEKAITVDPRQLKVSSCCMASCHVMHAFGVH